MFADLQETRLTEAGQVWTREVINEARWHVVRQHHLPSLEQVSSLASNLKDEARQAHEDDSENRMTTW